MPFIERNKERDREKKKEKKKGDIVKVQITKAYQQSQGVQLFFFCVRPLTCRSPNLFFPVVTPLELDFS